MSEITSKHSMFQSFQDGFRVACVELRSLDKIRQKLYSTMSESDSKLDLKRLKMEYLWLYRAGFANTCISTSRNESYITQLIG